MEDNGEPYYSGWSADGRFLQWPITDAVFLGDPPAEPGWSADEFLLARPVSAADLPPGSLKVRLDSPPIPKADPDPEPAPILPIHFQYDGGPRLPMSLALVLAARRYVAGAIGLPADQLEDRLSRRDFRAWMEAGLTRVVHDAFRAAGRRVVETECRWSAGGCDFRAVTEPDPVPNGFGPVSAECLAAVAKSEVVFVDQPDTPTIVEG